MSDPKPNLPPESPRQFTTIDLTRRGDVAMVRRALIHDWPVPDHIRRDIVKQLGPAMDAAAGNARLTVKLAELALMMVARNMIAEGLPAGLANFRSRKPERRKPRQWR